MVSGKGSIPTLSGVLNNSCKIHFFIRADDGGKKGGENKVKRGKSQKCNKKLILPFFRGSGDHFKILTEEKNGEEYWVSCLDENIVSA